MRPYLSLFVFVMLVMPGGCNQVQQKPNVLIILADDMGYSDLGCYGSKIHTPNLDSLAAGGLRMTQFYNAARCCPTRASLLTGLYQHQAGVGLMDYDVGSPEYQGYLNDECVTIAEVLKEAGYRTYHAGKWHVGREKGQWPLDRGFERYYGLIDGAASFYGTHHHSNPDDHRIFLNDTSRLIIEHMTDQEWADNKGFYMTDAFTDHAVKFLAEHEDPETPFFLYLAYTAPHWPLHAFPEDYSKYLEVFSVGWDRLREQRMEQLLENGIIDDQVSCAPLDEQVVPWDSASSEAKQEFILEMALYAGMIDRMDRNIGRVVRQLEDMGALDNTLVIFFSDNGGCHTTPRFRGEPGMTGGPRSLPCYGYMGAELSNVPFRKYKQFIHEGGIATPFIAHYPDMIAPGRIDHQAAHTIDIMPTIIELCGADYPERKRDKAIKPLPGTSLVEVFNGRQMERGKPVFWEHVGNKGIRSGEWKLVAAKPSLEWELYNISEDRSELNNLIDRHPEKAEELQMRYEEWAEANRIRPWDVEKNRLRE